MATDENEEGISTDATSRVQACWSISDRVDPKSIRGSAITDVMSFLCSAMADVDIGGAWWATAESYERMSEPVQILYAFLSHTWSATRWTKFLQLALVFNSNTALVVSACASILFASLVVIGAAPIVHSTGGRAPSGILGYSVGVVAFYIVLFLWPDLARCLGLKNCSARVFFDKMCINQVDEAEKKRGIAALGSALRISRRMIVLHSPVYLRRLWTSFELSTFTALRSTTHLIWIPEFLTVSIMSCSILLTTLSLIFVVMTGALQDAFVAEVMYGAACLVGFAILFELCRRWAGVQTMVDHDMASFDIRRAECSNEADREVVTDLIAHMEEKICGSEMSKENALDRFNMRVRQDVRNAFAHSLGWAGFPYERAIVALWTNLLWMPDEFAAMVYEGLPWQEIVLEMCIDLVETCCTFPLVFLVLLFLSRRCMKLRQSRHKEFAYNVACSIMTASLHTTIMMVARLLQSVAATDVRGLVAFVAFIGYMAMGTYMVYRE